MKLTATTLVGSDADDNAMFLTVSNNRIFVVGTTTGTLPGAVKTSSQDIFVAAIGINGSLLWTYQIGGAEGDNAPVAVKMAGDAILIAGRGISGPANTFDQWDTLIVAKVT